MEGWLNINKHKNITSNDIISILKKKFNLRKLKIKIGHAGTLDPLATGVLPIAIGKYTKLISTMMDAKKEYKFIIKFGIQTSSGDLDGKILNTENVKILFDDEIITEESLKQVCNNFIGKIIQTPPIYSAIKINGQRAYDLARRNIEFEMPSREIEIFSLSLESFSKSECTACYTVLCSKGTYIRTLAEDIAKKLGTIGVVIDLVRIRVGNFNQKNAIDVNTVEEHHLIN